MVKTAQEREAAKSGSNVAPNDRSSHPDFWTDPTTHWGHRALFMRKKQNVIPSGKMSPKCCASGRWKTSNRWIYGVSLVKIGSFFGTQMGGQNLRKKKFKIIGGEARLEMGIKDASYK